MIKKILLISLLLFSQLLVAKGIEQSEESFLNEVFANKPPQSSVIWLDREKKRVIEDVLQHRAAYIRIRYWQQGSRTAWILHEIGKEKPITVGVFIDQSQIQRLKVLAFRESRGWEVKHDFFTRQFTAASITDELQLNKTIDGISGATLSVRALKKIAKIALYLEQFTAL
ncbi:MAG: FMN-binding protein [Cycloclasticus sp.]